MGEPMMPRPIQATVGRLLLMRVPAVERVYVGLVASAGRPGLGGEPVEGLRARAVARLVLQADPAVVTGLGQLVEEPLQRERAGAGRAAPRVVGDLDVAGPRGVRLDHLAEVLAVH